MELVVPVKSIPNVAPTVLVVVNCTFAMVKLLTPLASIIVDEKLLLFTQKLVNTTLSPVTLKLVLV